VAADGWRVESARDRTGQRVAGADQHVPTGNAHAVPKGADTTMCGLQVESLAPFGFIDFEHASFSTTCRICKSSVAT
jgi:hypothetical protein